MCFDYMNLCSAPLKAAAGPFPGAIPLKPELKTTK